MTTPTLPPEIAALTTGEVKANIALIDAWAKTIDPGIFVTFGEERVRPPRKLPRFMAKAAPELEEVEQARADSDPGPCCIKVFVREKLTDQVSCRMIHLHTSTHTFTTAMLARAELAETQAIQAERRKTHVISDAEANSAEEWNYAAIEVIAHHSLAGTLCKESIADATYVANEKRVAELLDIIKGDWQAALVDAVGHAQRLSTSTVRGGGRAMAIAMAAERRSRAGATASK